jgi:4-diphosphocytidyl-2-C-methyl-D-erythritol kinase
MCNEVLHLGLSLNELAQVGIKVGADVPFFIYNYTSANVSGIGEIVEEYKEEALEFDIYTPNIQISTPKVYKSYRENFYAPIDDLKVDNLKKTTSLDILKSMDAYEANDLFKPALKEYIELKDYYKNTYFFSGSGSSFFKVIRKRES